MEIDSIAAIALERLPYLVVDRAGVVRAASESGARACGGAAIGQHVDALVEATARPPSALGARRLPGPFACAERIEVVLDGEPVTLCLLPPEKAFASHRHTVAELDRLAYAVSHDLAAPIRAIRLLAELLIEDHSAALPPAAAESLALLVDRAGRLSELSAALLAYSRAGREPGPSVPVDLERLLDALEHERPPPAGMALVIERPLPIVLFDQARLGRALAALLENAYLHSRAGRVVIRARAADGRVALEIADDGVGLGPAQLGRAPELFESFADPPRVGAGLAVAKRALEAGGGTLALEDGAPGLRVILGLPAPA